MKRYHLDIQSTKQPHFYDDIVKQIIQAIKDNYPDDDTNNIFHENGKYMEEAIMIIGNSSIPDIRLEPDEELKKNFKNS